MQQIVFPGLSTVTVLMTMAGSSKHRRFRGSIRLQAHANPNRHAVQAAKNSPFAWGWYYLSTIPDDVSRYIVPWKLCSTMKAGDVTDTLEMELAVPRLDRADVRHRPRLVSDNGSSYVAGDLAD